MLETRTRRYSQNKLSYLGSFHWRPMLKKVSIIGLFQAIHALVEWKLHRSRCSSRPFAFRIESAAKCNLRCPLCSTTYRKFNAGDVSMMTLGLFRTILKKIGKRALRITFYMEGEPMMNPRLFEMIELCARYRHIFTSFSTNLTLMRESLLDPLFRSRIDWISVSLDGFRQETYETYRVNGRVQDVLDGIRMILTSRRRNRLRYPYIQVNMIDFFHISAQERDELKKFCSAHKVDEFRTRPDQFGLMGHYDATTVRKPPSKCHWPWISMSIDCDGSVYPCPIAFEQRMSYGNLATTSLDEIWNGELYVATRTYLSQKMSPRAREFLVTTVGGMASVRIEDVVEIRKQWLQAARTRSAVAGDLESDPRSPG